MLCQFLLYSNVNHLYILMLHAKLLRSCPTLCEPMVALQVPLCLGFSGHWSELPCLPPGDLLNPGIKPAYFMSPALAGGFFTTGTTWEAQRSMRAVIFTVATTTSSIFFKAQINKWT